MTKLERERMLCLAMESGRLAARRLATGNVVKRADALSTSVERQPASEWRRASAFAWTAEADARLADAFAVGYARAAGGRSSTAEQ